VTAVFYFPVSDSLHHVDADPYLANLQKRFGTFRQIADDRPAPHGAAE